MNELDTSTTPEHRRPGFPLLLMLGFVLLQVVWVLAVPPFRASDEFDHAYRAAAVARGQWFPLAGASERGAFVTVPADLVSAAHAECRRLTYTTSQDCSPVAVVGPSLVTVSSGAGRYNPAFYAVVGTVAKPFHGTAALYAMRVAAAALCAAMFALVLTLTRSWARSRWPFVALAVACPPVVMYSTAVAAPNGLELISGLALAAAVIGVVRHREHVPAAVVTGASIAAVLLVTLRSLGPLWFVLIVLVGLILAEDRGRLLRGLLRRRDVLSGVAAVIVAGLASGWWILAVRPLAGGPTVARSDTSWDALGYGLESTLGWLLQSVAAFPYRNQLAPVVVYACALALFLAVVGAAVRMANARERVAMELIVLVALTLPLALTALSYPQLHDVAWQGRYGLPFTLALLVVAGSVLDRLVARAGPRRLLLTGVVVLNVLIQVPGPLRVLARERAASPGFASGAWPAPTPVLLGVVAVFGAALMMWGAAVGDRVSTAGAAAAGRRDGGVPVAR